MKGFWVLKFPVPKAHMCMLIFLKKKSIIFVQKTNQKFWMFKHLFRSVNTLAVVRSVSVLIGLTQTYTWRHSFTENSSRQPYSTRLPALPFIEKLKQRRSLMNLAIWRHTSLKDHNVLSAFWRNQKRHSLSNNNYVTPEPFVNT